MNNQELIVKFLTIYAVYKADLQQSELDGMSANYKYDLITVPYCNEIDKLLKKYSKALKS